MGQSIVVTEKPSSNRGVVRFETNRALTGMGHERYVSGEEVWGNRPPDELARRLLVLENVAGVQINANMVTVDLQKGFDSTGIVEVIENLYRFYPDAEDAPAGDAPVAEEPPAEGAPAEDAPAEEPVAEDTPAEDAPAEEPVADAAPAAEEAPAVEEAPAEETPAAEEAPAEDAPAEEDAAPVAEESPAEEASEDAPADEPVAEADPS